MKKIIAKILSLALVLAVVTSIFSACDLITVDKDKDMNQVIATVKINDEVLSENIYKKELNAGFWSYGYQYVEDYGYTFSQAYQAVLDNLVSNKVIIQYAKYELAKDDKQKLKSNEATDLLNNYFNADKIDKTNEEKYIIAQIDYELKKNINNLIDSYVEEDKEKDEKEFQEVPATRTTPTVATRTFKTSEKFDQTKAVANEDELNSARITLEYKASENDDFLAYLNEFYTQNLKKTVETGKTIDDVITVGELDLAVFNKYTIDEDSTKDIRKARKQLLEFLNTNGLITDDELNDANKKLVEMSYFVNMKKTLVEQAIVTKYEESLHSISEVTLNIENLWTEYVREYKSQNAKYLADTTSYETALDGISDTSFVLANPYENYGYVMHLLVPFSEEQKAVLDKYATDNPNDETGLIAKRELLAKDIVAKDQRESWVYSSYGNYSNGEFTFEDKYHVDGSNATGIDKFVGEVVVRDEDGYAKDYEKTTWNFENVVASEIKFEDFITTYVTPNTGIDAKYFDEDDVNSTVGTLTDYSNSERALQIRKNFNDLVFAFSTDTGSLNKEYGYSYSPLSSETNYVAKFAAASRAVVEKGEGSYTIVVSEYGYHIILCTKKVNNEAPYTIDESNLKTVDAQFRKDIEDGNVDSLAYRFRKTKLDSLISIDIKAISQGKINVSLNDGKSVTYFEKTYSDLIQGQE